MSKPRSPSVKVVPHSGYASFVTVTWRDIGATALRTDIDLRPVRQAIAFNPGNPAHAVRQHLLQAFVRLWHPWGDVDFNDGDSMLVGKAQRLTDSLCDAITRYLSDLDAPAHESQEAA